MDEWMDGLVDRLMDEWMDGLMDEWMKEVEWIHLACK